MKNIKILFLSVCLFLFKVESRAITISQDVFANNSSFWQNEYYDQGESFAISENECKKQWDKDVNQCHKFFLIDVAACFIEGIWGIVTGCFAEAVRDQQKCNITAKDKYDDCLEALNKK